MSLHVETFAGGPLATNAYLVFDDGSKQILIVDAPMDVDQPLQDRVSELGGEVVLLVLTHAHWDHIGTINELRSAFSAPVAAHPLTKDRLEHPDSVMLDLPFELAAVSPDRWLHEGDRVPLGRHEFTVMHLPGHDPGHIGLYSEPDGLLLSGDVLFPNGHGRIDIPGASQTDMAASLGRLVELPGDVTVYPGHGLPTTIGAEPWLSGYKRAQP
ncbi:MAG: MBL fold metallo-hydrolase [Thermomicrobiales bacterium]|nr:MBL fold metallo-hydrolase [Thermomicrobiales bacterium]MCO5220588.1 MBL fold metallo-hydrolase [Thermomicrobiales bacterium]